MEKFYKLNFLGMSTIWSTDLKYKFVLEKFLGHLSHSGDLLLWVGVRRRPSSVVRRALTSSPQKLLGQS